MLCWNSNIGEKTKCLESHGYVCMGSYHNYVGLLTSNFLLGHRLLSFFEFIWSSVFQSCRKEYGPIPWLVRRWEGNTNRGNYIVLKHWLLWCVYDSSGTPFKLQHWALVRKSCNSMGSWKTQPRCAMRWKKSKVVFLFVNTFVWLIELFTWGFQQDQDWFCLLSGCMWTDQNSSQSWRVLSSS